MNTEKNTGKLGLARIVSIVFFLLLGSFYLCRHETNDCYRVEVIQSNSGYGYKLYEGKRTIILQPFIPAVPGKMAFQTREDAQRIGNLVMQRMKAGGSFSISKADLNNLRITY